MANSISHASLPFCVKGARYTIPVPYLDADGDPTDPTTPDTELSIDGAAYADAAEEVTTISGSLGSGYLTLSGAETNCSLLFIAAKVASGPKTTLAVLNPRLLPVEHSGTAQAGAAGTITLASGASAIDDYYNGCIIKTTGGTGGGGTGGANNQARIITDYNGSTKVATIAPDWETNPSSDTTYEVLLTDMACNALRALRPTTDQRTLNVTAGVAEANAVQISGDATAADNWETMLDGTGGQTFSLGALTVSGAFLVSGGTTFTNSAGTGFVCSSSGSNGHGIAASGNGSGDGANFAGGSTGGHGAEFIASANSCHGINAVGQTGHGISATGASNNSGIRCTAGTNGVGFSAVGGTNGVGARITGPGSSAGLIIENTGSSHAISITTVSGNGINIAPTAGHGINIAANGTDKHGILVTGGTAGTSDGIKVVAGTGGVDIRGNITGNITGTLSTVTTLTNLPAITANWLTAAGLATDAVDEIVDAVWDEATSGHTTAGTTGKALTDAGSAGDPWGTALPGAYGAGTAGKIIGDNINATISSRATQTSVDTIDGIVDAILADTGTDGVVVNTFTTAGKAEIEAEANDALVANNLDHLLAVAAVAGDAVDSSIIARLASKSATPSFASFLNTDDSLEAIRDRGDAAWTGGGGGDATLANQTVIIGHLTDIKGATFSGATDSLEAIRDRGDVAWVTATGFSTLTQADVRTAVGLALANLDTQLSGINAKTTNLPASPAAVGSAMTLANGAITEDTITTPAETAGRPTGILGMIRRIFERLSNKRTRDRSTGTVLLRNEADSATLETQTQSTSGTVDTQTKGV